MRFALAQFTTDPQYPEMLPALYCAACGTGRDETGKTHWQAVILQDGEDFCCDACFTTEPERTPINGSRYVIERIEAAANA